MGMDWAMKTCFLIFCQSPWRHKHKVTGRKKEVNLCRHTRGANKSLSILQYKSIRGQCFTNCLIEFHWSLSRTHRQRFVLFNLSVKNAIRGSDHVVLTLLTWFRLRLNDIYGVSWKFKVSNASVMHIMQFCVHLARLARWVINAQLYVSNVQNSKLPD